VKSTCWAIALGGIVVASASASAQPKSAAGTFDGKYVGVSIRCFPNAIALPSISFYVVSGNSFSHQFNFNGETRRCTLSIGADGAFSNKDCGVPTSGKVVGDRLDVEFKAPESICNVVLKRER